MKRTVLVFGSIAGAILAAMLFASVPMMRDDRMFEGGQMMGYAGMVAAFLLVFFGVRSYRENVGRGAISFGRAVVVGELITLVASACYVAAWQVIYFGGMAGDFGERYAAYTIEQARENGATDAELAEKRAQMERFTEMYRNPVFNAGMTLLEPLPVGLVMTLVSAGILRRRRREEETAGAAQRGVRTGVPVL